VPHIEICTGQRCAATRLDTRDVERQRQWHSLRHHTGRRIGPDIGAIELLINEVRPLRQSSREHARCGAVIDIVFVIASRDITALQPSNVCDTTTVAAAFAVSPSIFLRFISIVSSSFVVEVAENGHFHHRGAEVTENGLLQQMSVLCGPVPLW
jgi:hypothetical protein